MENKYSDAVMGGFNDSLPHALNACLEFWRNVFH